jgi:hypothetical protein
LLLERHDPQSGVTSKLRVSINLLHSCLELQEPAAAAAGGAAAGGRCLRTVNSLDEALAALHGRNSQLLASPRASPARGSAAAFQSPSKPPRRAARGADLAREGAALLHACSSAQLREGATLVQAAAAATPPAAGACVELGALESLVTAAAAVLPSSIMGTTEQLTLLALTVSSVLDAAPPSAGGAARVVAALAAALRGSCANPLLLGKLLVALLQRPDVRVEAMAQDLASTISDAYLRRSPLLEPLARALLSPATLAGRAGASVAADLGVLGSPAGAPRGGGGGSGGGPAPSAAGALVAEWQTPPLTARRGAGVPRLALPADDGAAADTPKSGLTRATRREMGRETPRSGWRTGAAGGAWDSPLPASAGRGASAADEMQAMAESLGESLLALDLPAAVAHKRRADALRGPPPDDDGVPAELLEPPAPSARQSAVQAHAIFTTARSMRSLDSRSEGSVASAHGRGGGEEEADDAAAAARRGGGGREMFGVQLADAAEVKALLLQALMAALPVMGAGGETRLSPFCHLRALHRRDTCPSKRAMS